MLCGKVNHLTRRQPYPTVDICSGLDRVWYSINSWIICKSCYTPRHGFLFRSKCFTRCKEEALLSHFEMLQIVMVRLTIALGGINQLFLCQSFLHHRQKEPRITSFYNENIPFNDFYFEQIFFNFLLSILTKYRGSASWNVAFSASWTNWFNAVFHETREPRKTPTPFDLEESPCKQGDGLGDIP